MYSPHSAQLAIHNSKARFRVASWGRQSGKSTWGVNELLKRAWENLNTTYWFLSPTYDQARVQYRRTVGSLYACQEIMQKRNQTELRIKLINGSQIMFKSGEVLDNLRGETLAGVIVDEVRDQHSDLWGMVLRPMLATTGGWAAFISTPNGFDQFYDFAQKAKTDKDWEFFTAPSTCNPAFTQEEYERLKSELPEAYFAQEINAEFRDLTAGKAYLNYSDANLSLTNPFATDGGALSKHLPIVVALDFNVAPMAWTLGQERNGDFYWYNEIWIKNTTTQECAAELVRRVRGHAPGVILIGDASGNSRNTKSAQSDYAIICNALTAANIRWQNRTPDANPAVQDRVNTVNAKLKSADGSIHMWIHPVNCPMLKRDLERVVWKESSTSFVLDQVKDKTLTHSSDGIGYAVCVLSPLRVSGSVGSLRVIVR